MPARFPAADIQRAARLARVELREEEAALFARQLGDVMDYVKQIQAIDTSDVPPLSHLAQAGAALRADAVAPSLDRAAALDAAPETDPARIFFKVPRVLGS